MTERIQSQSVNEHTEGYILVTNDFKIPHNVIIYRGQGNAIQSRYLLRNHVSKTFRNKFCLNSEKRKSEVTRPLVLLPAENLMEKENYKSLCVKKTPRMRNL